MESNENRTIIIDKEHAGGRADSVLSCCLEDISRSYAARLIEQGRVLADGNMVGSKNERFSEGCVVTVMLPEPKPCEAQPEEMPLDVLYEDDDLLVVNKPRGLVVHPAAGNEYGTLVNGLLWHCRGRLSSINGVERPGIVHRIDKDTSGLLVIAKTDEAHKSLASQLEAHSVTRRYRAIVFFNMPDDEGIIDAPVGRDPKDRLRMAVVPGGRRAVTHWRVLERFSGFTEIEARLETGRTHQIRVHMAHIHHPLLGDTVYGPAKQPFRLDGQLLHAGVLGFVHPSSGEYMEFSCEPPEIYTETIAKLRNRR